MNRLLFYITLAARISPSLHALSTSAHAPELESEGLDVLAGPGYGVSATLRCLPKYLSVHS